MWATTIKSLFVRHCFFPRLATTSCSQLAHGSKLTISASFVIKILHPALEMLLFITTTDDFLEGIIIREQLIFCLSQALQRVSSHVMCSARRGFYEHSEVEKFSTQLHHLEEGRGGNVSERESFSQNIF